MTNFYPGNTKFAATEPLTVQQRTLVETILNIPQTEVDQLILKAKKLREVQAKWSIAITFHHSEKKPAVSIRRIDMEEKTGRKMIHNHYGIDRGRSGTGRIDIYC
ncbi:hypothetical protein [Sporolactobacillus pectinivorans]|uniref:hypothetical protein n=1 Tax=Sporolactobacillus pectinivorans TaxID=1591408 RepID=UPI000C25DECB|nr:hypothetical protein [Sporolactobacillus pectinivorans]